MANTIRLIWGAVDKAVSYNIYSSTRPGLSVALSPLLINVTGLLYDHTSVTSGITYYYILAAVGPNGEIGPPSQEISVLAEALLTSITVTPISFSLGLGLQQQFTATGHYSDSSTQDITDTVTWSTSDSNLATVSNTIIVSVPDVVLNGTFEGGTLASWAITTGTLALPQYTFGNSLDLGGDDSDPNAYLSNVSVINTDSHSGTKCMMVGSSANGPEDAGYNEVTQVITVPNVGTPHLSFWVKFFNPDGDSILYDFQQALLVHPISGATLIDLFSEIDGGPDAPFVDLDTQVWTNFNIDISAYAGTSVRILFRNRGDGSSDPSWFLVDDVQTVASGDPKGTVTANAYDGGSVNIIATLALTSGNTSLAIIPTLTSIAVTKDAPSGNTIQFTATGTYSDSSTRDLTLVAAWLSSQTSVGTIDAYGLFTLVGGIGTTNVSATFHSLSDSLNIVTINAWGNEASIGVTELGGFALASNNLFVNNSYTTPSRIIKSTGNGTWTDTVMSLGGNDPGNTVGVWGTGSLVLVGGQGGNTSNAIIRSTNAGSTWNTVSNSFTNQVWWIHGSSSSNIWAAGGTNILLKSIDSGATWSSISFPGGFLESVYAISSSDVWVGGDNASFTSGVLYHYNGSTFTSFYSNLVDTVFVNSIWASSSTDIYILASSTDYVYKYIYHSTNGGTTFTLELKVFNAVSNAYRPKIFGISSTSIYAGVAPSHIFHSNGSGTWTREYVELPYGNTGGFTNEIDALLGTDDSHVWAAGVGGGPTANAFIIKRNKAVILSPVLTTITVTGATSISGTAQYRATGTYDDGRVLDLTSEVTWSSTNTGVATISNTMRTIGLATNTGAGSTNITATLGSVSGFLAVSGSAAWTVFYDKANQPTSPATGYSHVPATGGNIAQYTGLAKIGNTVVASNGVQSWYATAASIDGKYPFLTTTDNGATFHVASWPLATDSNQALDGNSFYAPNIYATTDKFLVGCERNKTSNLTTSTDGLTWSTSVQLSPNSRAVAAFHSTSNSNIWAVSDTPTGSIYVWQSTNDGASWTAIGSPISSGGSTYFPSIFTISSTDVWVAGATNGTNANPCVYHWNGSTWTDCSAALRTARGGNFNALIIGIYASGTNDVYFIDANWGHNQLYHTSNQGTSFTVIDVDPAHSVIFNAIAGTSSSNIYLAGYSGNIYHYNGSTWTKETLPASPSYIATSDYLGLWIDGSTVYACGNNIIKK